MSLDKDKENLEKLFLKSNEKDIFAKIQEQHSLKFYLSNLLNEEMYLKNGILEVLELAIKYNKVYVFNETWKKISKLTNTKYKLEIYREILSKVLNVCDKKNDILKIVSNKISYSLNELEFKVLGDAFKNRKTDNLIFFFEKRRLKKHNDLIECEKEIVDVAYFYNNYDLLRYLKKRHVNIFGENYVNLKNAAISGKTERLDFMRTIENISFRDVIDWSKENIQPHKKSDKWLKIIEFKEELSAKLPTKQEVKTKVRKI